MFLQQIYKRREQQQAKSLLLSEGIAEPHPILYKYTNFFAHLQNLRS